MVTTLTGALQDPHGVSAGLSNATDRVLMSVLAQQMDVVLVGAQTVRDEQFELPYGYPLAVLTGSGVVTVAEFDTPGTELRGRHLIVAARPGVPVVTNVPDTEILRLAPAHGQSAEPAAAAIAALQARGYTRILCEGGAHVATALLNAGVVDELCLTVNLATGGIGRWSTPMGLHKWTPASVLLDEGHDAIYLRLTRAT